MSCIFKNEEGEIILMCKGADSVIEERLSLESKTSEMYKKTKIIVDGYANEGLRTLYLAERNIEQNEYDDWNQKVQQAKLEINDREEKVAKEDEKIEHDRELVGSTAIEDRLQDEVKDTVEFMRRANIKVWVLTGDKVETAINIGISAGLLD